MPQTAARQSDAILRQVPPRPEIPTQNVRHEGDYDEAYLDRRADEIVSDDADLPLYTPVGKATAIATSAQLLARCRQYLSESDVSRIQAAFRYADDAHLGQFRKSGEPYITHPLAVATILAEWHLDAATICAGLMHDVLEDTGVAKIEMAEQFGIEVTEIVDGVSKLDKLRFSSNEIAQAESFRKMLLAMSRDVRVILVKLADRLHNLRTLGVMRPEKRRRIATETLEIYVPIAHRLGLNTVFRELQELSFFNQHPLRYEVLRKNLIASRGKRRAVLERILRETREALPKHHIVAQVQGRDKTIYGIYNRMRDTHASFSDVLDIYGFRVIVRTREECYLALCALHELYKPVHRRFKDFIAIPKANGYQSLHTTVIGREAIPFEVQIRTREMDRNAEYGIAAHWKYKAGITAASSDRLDERLAWVRQLLESQRSSIDATDLLSDIKSDLLPEEVFAFTPRGDVINLPAGATVIDFAYAIHSAVGNRMIGAKVNNRIVPIDHQVVTGEIIEIITGPENRGPSRDWLNIVKTSEAKNKIRNWFKKERRDENIAEGKDAFEKELRRNLMVIPPEQYDEFMSNLARRNHCNSVDEMYAAIGYGGLQLARILPKLKEEYTRLKATEPKPLPTVDIKRVHSSDGVVVEGIDNCPIKFAKCCSPLPGDDIIGFVTRGFGVSIHKRDCANVQQSMKDPENAARWVKSYWADDAKEDYKATLELDCMDRANLLSDVALALGDMRVPIYSLSARAADQGRARMSLTVGIMNTVHLNNVVARLRKVKDVLTVTRN